MQIVLATSNSGKVAEIEELLRSLDPELQVVGLDAYPDIGPIAETGTTFEANALLKAREVCIHTHRISLADDSGLEVDALDGAPGVLSARYSGEQATDAQNNAKLLSALEGLTPEQRRGRFRCVLTVWAPSGEYITVSGSWEGWIATQPRGEHGFGYDPVFVDLDTGRTAAEMSREEKSSRSHRGQALRELLRQWPDFVARTSSP